MPPSAAVVAFYLGRRVQGRPGGLSGAREARAGTAGQPGQPPAREGTVSLSRRAGAPRPPRTKAPVHTNEEDRVARPRAVLQAIRLHFVTDFWTLPPTLPPSGASSRNSPPPQDRNPFQTSQRQTARNESYIILFGQTAKKKIYEGDVVISLRPHYILSWRSRRCVRDFAEAAFPPVSNTVFCRKRG
jgi:hypothetical protein